VTLTVQPAWAKPTEGQEKDRQKKSPAIPGIFVS